MNYVASKADLETVKEALRAVRHPAAGLIFKDLSKINRIVVVSYDSKFIYIWRLKTTQLIHKIDHDLKIRNICHGRWQAKLNPPEVNRFLPVSIRKKTEFEVPIISGGLFTPFITVQESKKIEKNPYTTRESYLATIFHEIGHIYWNQHKLWWHSDKRKNLEILRLSRKLYEEGKISEKIEFSLPTPVFVSEIFAFCVEYCASIQFYQEHKTNLDKFAASRIEELIKSEKNRNLDEEDSSLEPYTDPHSYAVIIGRLILNQYPADWVDILTSRLSLFPKSYV